MAGEAVVEAELSRGGCCVSVRAGDDETAADGGDGAGGGGAVAQVMGGGEVAGQDAKSLAPVNVATTPLNAWPAGRGDVLAGSRDDEGRRGRDGRQACSAVTELLAGVSWMVTRTTS